MKANDNWLVTAKIVTALSIVLFLLSMVLPDKIRILVNIVLLLVLMYYLAISMLNKLTIGKLSLIWTTEVVCFGLLLFIQSDYYFFTGNGTMTFYVVSLMVGVSLGILLPVLKRETLKSLSVCIKKGVVIAFCATLVSIIVLPNLNYVLDFSKPQFMSVEISGKKANNVFRGPDTYEFMFESEGETYFINVPENIYDEYRSGDTFQLLVYNGAFGEEFYIGEDCTTKIIRSKKTHN